MTIHTAIHYVVHLAAAVDEAYTTIMIRLRFPNPESERKALGFLAGRFPFKTYAGGCTLVPDSALSRLALEGIAFTVEGRAAYEQLVSQVRNSAAPAVQ